MNQLIHTFSIVAYDPINKEWGVAVQSKFLAAAAVVSWARAKAGAVATQSYANVSYGFRGLDLMESGNSAEETIQILIKDDEDNIIGGLEGDMDVRNNRITLLAQVAPDADEPGTEFVVQSFDGDIDVRNNKLENNVARIDVTSSGSGDTSVKNNEFLNNQTTKEIKITSEDGDVGVWNNTFGESVNEVNIDSTTGQCESKRNRPELVDQFACPSP